MNPVRLVLILFLLTMVSVGCSQAREAGRSAAGGAFDELQDRADAFRAWYEREGKAEIKGDVVEVVKAGVDGGLDAAGAKLKLEFQEKVQAARDALNREWQERLAVLEKKVQEGKATPMEMVLYFILGGLGAGGSKVGLERLFIGKRQTGVDMRTPLTR